MNVYVIRDRNYGNICDIYTDIKLAEKDLESIKKLNKKLYNDRYNWVIEAWKIKESIN